MASELSWVLLGGGRAVSSDGRRLLLIMQDPQRVTNTFPPTHCRTAPAGDGRTLVMLPLRSDTLTLLRNLGLSTAGIECLRFQYDAPLIEGKFPPMPHQVTTAAVLSENPRAFCTSTMRTGKTASTILAADYLLRRKDAAGVLIVCTVSTMVGVWQKEIEGMLPHATIRVLYGSKANRREQLSRAGDYFIINYDGLKLLKPELMKAVDAGRIDVCIVDEMTHYANAQTARWSAADEVLNGTRWSERTTASGVVRRRREKDGVAIKYVWGLTGTPGGPEGVYGQIKLVNPTHMNMQFTAWREMVMTKVNSFKWLPRAGHKDVIHRHMQPCISFDKKDIMDLPPVVFQHRECELSKAQDKVYKQLKREMLIEAADGNEVKAVNKAALITKLLQVACGEVRGTEGHVSLDSKPRLAVLEEIIKESQTKVVVFSAFTAVLDRLRSELEKTGHRVAVVDGRVTGKKRDTVFSEFQREDKLDVLLCHPQTTAFGVELSAADTIVFYGPPLSGEFVYQQAVERLSSLSQKADQVGIVHLTATYEERKLFKAIKDGVDVNEAINDLFRNPSNC